MADTLTSENDVLEKVFTINNEDVVSRSIAGETIIVPIRGSLDDMQKLYALDSVGEFIWQRLDGKRKIKDICEEVVKAFQVEKDRAEDDLKGFLSALLKERLVKERE